MEVPVFQAQEIANLKSQRFTMSLGWLRATRELISQEDSDGGWVVDGEIREESRGSDEVQFINLGKESILVPQKALNRV